MEWYKLLGHGLQTLFRMLCGHFILPEPANHVFFIPLFICAMDSTLSRYVIHKHGLSRISSTPINAKKGESAALNAHRSTTMSLSVTDSTKGDLAALNAPRVSRPRYQSHH